MAKKYRLGFVTQPFTALDAIMRALTPYLKEQALLPCVTLSITFTTPLTPYFNAGSTPVQSFIVATGAQHSSAINNSDFTPALTTSSLQIIHGTIHQTDTLHKLQNYMYRDCQQPYAYSNRVRRAWTSVFSPHQKRSHPAEQKLPL